MTAVVKASGTDLLALAARVWDVGESAKASAKALQAEALAAIDTPADHAHRAAAQAWVTALPAFAEVGSALSAALAEAAACYIEADVMPQGPAAAQITGCC